MIFLYSFEEKFGNIFFKFFEFRGPLGFHFESLALTFENQFFNVKKGAPTNPQHQHHRPEASQGGLFDAT